MRRSEALASLSRDHHQALTQAMKLKRATPGGEGELTRGLLAFWNEHGSRHFQVEEEVLLPAYARHADPGQDAVVQRAGRPRVDPVAGRSPSRRRTGRSGRASRMTLRWLR